MIMDESDYENDISWLTQTPKLEDESPNFEIGVGYIEEDIVGVSQDKNIVSLEENSVTEQRHVLYDNVVAEDISDDEIVDSM